MIVSGRTLAHDVTIDAPACVVGTGAGGSVVLRELARAGLSPIGLEEGPDHGAFDQREERMLPELFQEHGGRMTDDLGITVLGGRGLGGSTIHNTNLCKRIPPEVLAEWKKTVSGLDSVGSSFDAIERDLSVSPIPEVNANNDILRRGVNALGWRGGLLSHNRVGCIGSGFCELGCAYNAKQNARKVLIPEALERGARIYCDVRALRIQHDGAVSAVIARAASGATVTIRTKVVVLAGSAVGSAALALASNVPDPHVQQGQSLRIHPGSVVAGVFDRDIDGWRGIPQSWECTEHLDFREGSEKRVWITTAFAHPIGTAVTLPGFGAAHMKMMRSYRKLAVLTAMVHDQTAGRVYVDGERPRLRYKMLPSDRAQMTLGLRACAEILLAAGAREVMIPGVPPRTVRRASELASVEPRMIPLTAVHPMGTMRMADSPRNGVVGPTGEHHHLKGLFVADGSLFPTSIGGPPQISIYAFALHVTPHIIAAARR